MTGALRVDPQALHAARLQLLSGARPLLEAAADPPGGALRQAGGALDGSAAGAVLGRLAAAVDAALDGSARAVRALAQLTGSAAETYVATERAVARTLR